MNGIKLFRVFGITVFLHWSWIVVAIFEIQSRRSQYESLGWNIAEYLMLFAIVLMHEFGHALACRSVGGSAEQIMLWPLGGVAYVSPPPRPGAMLWSIAAGPLVNVVLLLISLPLLWIPLDADAHRLLYTVATINAGLLIFNLLPIYPLDGGQILQSVLWFVMGRGRSMAVATVIGMVGAMGLAALGIYLQFSRGGQGYWLLLIAAFAGSQCWRGWKMGAQIRERENAQRRPGFACPSCGTPPMVGKYWRCNSCKTAFDAFETYATCPKCGDQFSVTTCGHCRAVSPFQAWLPATVKAPPPVPVSATVAL